MIDTRLVMALEELFKKEPFNLEIDTIVIYADRGTIQVVDVEDSEYAIDYEDL